jgi:SAM-dependent methyltransferase
MSADPLKRFSGRVDDYVRCRPSYPPQLLDCLAREFGLRPEHVVADIGSGTGLFTETLLQHGNQVFAVEPNGDMRRAAEQRFRVARSRVGGAVDPGRFHSIAGRAEATTLPDASVDWVAAAQAFHWFDVDAARREFARILRPAGRVALIWNDRREDTPFLCAYEQFVREHAIDYAAVKHRNAETDGRIERFFAPGGTVCQQAGHAPPYVRRGFANHQDFDFDGLRGRVESSSYMPARDHPRHEAMLAALRRLFDRHAAGGTVPFEYDTKLFVGTLS